MGPVFITVIGQCMGNRDVEGAEYYFRKLTKITLLISVVWNLMILLLTPVFLHFYSLSSETRRLVLMLVLIHNVCICHFHHCCAAAFVLCFWNYFADGRHRYCVCDGVRLGGSCRSFYLEGKDRKVEDISGN